MNCYAEEEKPLCVVDFSEFAFQPALMVGRVTHLCGDQAVISAEARKVRLFETKRCMLV